MTRVLMVKHAWFETPASCIASLTTAKHGWVIQISWKKIIEKSKHTLQTLTHVDKFLCSKLQSVFFEILLLPLLRTKSFIFDRLFCVSFIAQKLPFSSMWFCANYSRGQNGGENLQEENSRRLDGNPHILVHHNLLGFRYLFYKLHHNFSILSLSWWS